MPALKTQAEVVEQQPNPPIAAVSPRAGSIWEHAEQQARRNQEERVKAVRPDIDDESEESKRKAASLRAEADLIEDARLAKIATGNELLYRVERAAERLGRVQTALQSQRDFIAQGWREWRSGLPSGEFIDGIGQGLLVNLHAAEASLGPLQDLIKDLQAEVDQAAAALAEFSSQHPEAKPKRKA
jgi:hypothetical protein